ncbi:hypothetical protein HNQ91_003969 [Filimonas zeae]|uniref:Uncharacterized protein n=1 Tax=Filimonas zeae TaxID=1737353 RepID=A0A917J3A3_9BACT|nr:hypothetical protein [Filimonas zeae]MDR6340896.1 hypothetical protein [Filimonas zeae]GGH78034.1 hypothetical protein GCM10011379_45280 [Filimonas zeae]
MPIVRSSQQSNETLEGFYKQLESESTTAATKSIGADMLAFIAMINKTFVSTMMYGVTSHNVLCIQVDDAEESDWLILVNGIGYNRYLIEYKLPPGIKSCHNVTVKGDVHSLEEARSFLIVAMNESEGWLLCKELQRLYNKLWSGTRAKQAFSLWLEFEEVAPGSWNVENEFCNIQIRLEDGRRYGLNVWTYRFLETAIQEDASSGRNLNGLYIVPPDLFVKELTRDCVESAVRDLLDKGDLESVLNPGVYSKSREPF